GKIIILMVPVGLLAIALGLAIWSAASQHEPIYLEVLLPILGVIALGAWFYFSGRGWLSAWHQQRTDPSLQYPIHHLLSDNGLRVRGRSAEVTFGWRSMRAVTETRDFILFYYSHDAAYYLPKRVADSAQLAELRTLIRANTR